MLLDYDGSHCHGFQRQKNSSATVQEEMEKALAAVTGEHITVYGASRTDAGVHALGQVIAFDTQSSIPPEKFWLAVNTKLSPSLQSYFSEAVTYDFHPRFHAVKKHYTYLLYNRVKGASLWRDRAWCMPVKLSLAAMQASCPYLLGSHDFKAFCSSGSQVKSDFVRTVSHCSISALSGDLIRFDIMADGFLYNMVRIIVGTLVDIGKGRIAADALPDIIASRQRVLAGPTAPAWGLYLVQVFYPPNR